MSTKRSTSKTRSTSGITGESSTGMLGQTSQVASAGTAPKTGSSSRSLVGAGYVLNQAYSLPTDDAIKRLNLETRALESQKKARTLTEIEARVDDFLLSLDKSTRSQLSRTQLIKSLEKVLKWSAENKKYLIAVNAVPKEWLDLDGDPAEYSDKKAAIGSTGTTTSSSSSSSLPGSTGQNQLSTSSTGAQITSRYPTFSGYMGKQPDTQVILTGEIYERDRATKNPTPENQNITGKRVVKMKEWLQRRAGRQMDRDSIRKWITSTAKTQNLPAETVFKMYARKRQDLTPQELHQLFNMPDAKELSINELLTQYRSEVPVNDSRVTGMEDSSEDSASEDEPTNHQQGHFRTAAGPASSNAHLQSSHVPLPHPTNQRSSSHHHPTAHY